MDYERLTREELVAALKARNTAHETAIHSMIGVEGAEPPTS